MNYKNPPQTGKGAVASQFAPTPIQFHRHTGQDSPQISYGDIKGAPTSFAVPVYAGQVVSNAAGTFFPSGWTLTHTGTGQYTITHNLNSTAYAFVAYPTFSGEAYCISGYNPVDANNIEIYINNPDSSFGFQDSNFYFILTTQSNP